jgi:hypothetical protein
MDTRTYASLYITSINDDSAHEGLDDHYTTEWVFARRRVSVSNPHCKSKEGVFPI